MRKPATSADRIWVTDAYAARYLDIANALYSLMLRFLVQVYSMENRNQDARKMLMEGAFSSMHALAALAGLLTRLPANPDFPGTTAGVSFSLDRYFTPFELTGEKWLLLERLDEILDEVRTLSKKTEDQPPSKTDAGGEFAEGLEAVENMLGKLRDALKGVSLHTEEA